MTRDGNVWLNQNHLAELFDTSVPNISMHIFNIFRKSELDANSVVKDYLTTAADGKNCIPSGMLRSVENSIDKFHPHPVGMHPCGMPCLHMLNIFYREMHPLRDADTNRYMLIIFRPKT
jgi:hypothetical protein